MGPGSDRAPAFGLTRPPGPRREVGVGGVRRPFSLDGTQPHAREAPRIGVKMPGSGPLTVVDVTACTLAIQRLMALRESCSGASGPRYEAYMPDDG